MPEAKHTTEKTNVAVPDAKRQSVAPDNERARGHKTPVGKRRPERARHGKGENTGGAGGRRPLRRERKERPRSEFDHKVIGVRRVTRVVAGGRRFSFSAAVVIGNRKGSVGVGLGKAADTALAIEKATRDAKKHMLAIPLSKEMMIAHEVGSKYASSRVTIWPAPGKGVVAGSSVRIVLDLAGIKDAGAKILSRSKNPTNNARAAIKALGMLAGASTAARR
ncbi:MAG: 30S ribosomal protein S5 [Candidatus Lloydbacteria bacterium CG22_combo_CG10-13_8_21_14_all_47_15]|uniref:Small ribosomal subunit protein uS5 n=1 Tax=Candidatus Lloydbacteria bacterium CG22_combo_CG10-13_8_21_14_all_47_15 TaxID=1974635 RepID=A0A2H0CV85_9BACT|nr:MAG: 30S ribosomal protein S5 [Candidatus Lloydbacteria bacterium CG22_combo_CG10-13_8_21_14_all_47_15]